MVRASPRCDLAALKRSHPLEDLVARYGVALHPCGSVLMGRCPFHDDHEPSMLVDPRDDHYHCFGCRAHGDVLDFVQRLEGIDFFGALDRLGRSPASPRGGSAARHRQPSPPRPVASVPPNAVERACLSVAVGHYHERLLREPRALAYLEGRGLERRTMVERRLGFATGGSLPAALRRAGLPEIAARDLGLLNARGDEVMAGRIVIPELRDDEPTWLIGRALRPGAAPRYRALPGPKPLLGWATADGHATVVVTEGPFDWLTLRQWGYPALALVGTHTRRDLVRALDRFPTVVLALDQDAAGRAACASLAHALGPRARRVTLPPGVKDVAELASRPEGRARFASALKHAAHAPAA